MKVLIIDNDTKHIDSFKDLVLNADVISKHEIHSHPLHQYNAIILTGSQTHAVAIHRRAYWDETELIKNSDIPIFGICAGLELMVYAFGGSLKKMPKKIQEIHMLDIKEDPIFDGISDLVVYKGHRWIVDTLPGDFIPLAYSATGIEIIKHTNKLMYGVQFHPEAHLASTNGYILLNNFLKMVERRI